MAINDYNKGYYNAYQQSSNTVDQVQQIVMLYDGAINFIKQAKEAIIDKNYEKRYNLINKAIAIVTGLNSCLNFTEETAETAKALDEFYSMIDMRLLYIQCDDNLESCDKVVADLKRMRNAWADVAKETSEANFIKNNTVMNKDESQRNTEYSQENIRASKEIIADDPKLLPHTELQVTV